MSDGTKIIIRNYSETHSDADVMRAALKVVEVGRVSGNGTSYCFYTKFNDGLAIYAERNKMSDTLTAI